MGQKQIDESAVLGELDAISGLLDRILAFFGPNVLQGPAGARLAQGMQERRQELVSMMSTVAKDVAKANKTGFAYYPCVRRVPLLPCATKWVQIAPEAAERLQREMASDADGFVKHSRRISHLFAGVADSPNMLACERTAGWCREQERDLRKRVEYARAAEHVPFGVNGAAPGLYDHQRGMVTIPDWTEFGPGEQSKLARMQAGRVAAAFGAPNAKSRQELSAVATWLRANQNSPALLGEFWKHVGVQRAATLASVLNRQDRDSGMDPTKVLSDESKQIMTAFAASLATATRPRQVHGQPGGGAETAPPLPEFREGLATAAKSDMWSAGMLFKYGPKGDQWDAPLLSAMTKAVMEWQKTQVPTPPSSERQATLPLPAQPAIDVWYVERGMEPDTRVAGGKPAGHPRAQQAVVDFDPRSAIFGRLAENRQAARSTMQDREFVKTVLAANWAVPPFAHGQKAADASGAAGRALAAGARADRSKAERTAEGEQAAQVAVNILAATQDWSDKRPSKEMRLPAGLQEGLRTVAIAYMPDLANSLPTAGSKANPTSPDAHQVSSGGIPTVESNNIVVQTFMKEIFSDEIQLAKFRGAVQGYLLHAMQLNGSPESDRETIDAGVKLLRLVDGLDKTLDLDKAKQKDKDVAERKAYFSLIAAAVGQIPTPHGKVAGKVVDGAKKVAGLATPMMNIAFGTPNNAAKARVYARQESYERQQHLRVLIVQVLVNRGQLAPPPGAEWYQNKQVVPGSAFTKWFREHAHEHRMASGENISEFAKALATEYQEPVP